MMTKSSYSGYRFPPEIIQQAIWLYVRFTLSFRDVEDLLAERGILVSYETVRRWVNHFGPMIAVDLRRRRSKPHTIWHLDEVYLKIDGRLVYLWRAVDAEGEVLDVLVQTRRNKRAALKLMRKLLKKYGFVPDKLVTDDLIQIVRLRERDVLTEQIAHRAMLEPMPVQSPFAAGRNQLVAGQRLQDVQPARSFARGRQRRQPKLVHSQLITEEWPSSRRPTDEAGATAWRSTGSTPHRNREPAQDDPRETTRSVWIARRLHRRPRSPCSTPLSGCR